MKNVNDNEEFIIWTVTCVKNKEQFTFIDNGEDPYVQCPICGSGCDLHNIVISDKEQDTCWRCKGTGKTERFGVCPTCDGTGIEHFCHIRKETGKGLYIQIRKIFKEKYTEEC